jgi:hypothetical protein
MLFFICCKTSLGVDDKNFILWQNTKQLTFKDFKGKPNKLSNELFGHCATQYRFEHKIDNATKLPKFIIKCYFNKKMSFIINKKDTLTLRHEQIHFNIEELFCRKVRKSWDSLNILKEKKVGLYNKVRYKIHKKNNLLNNLFDKEEHSINGSILHDNIEVHADSILKKWELKIEQELNDLEKYK